MESKHASGAKTPIPGKRDEAEALKAEVQRFKELAARAQADLQNAKARLQKQAEDLTSFTLAQFLRSILPTLDHFQHALKHLPSDLKDHEWVKGVVAIEQGLLRQVESFGLKRFSALGQPLDPNRHDVLMNVPGEPGVVVDVVEEGYEFRGSVLRPAKVKVGRSAEAGGGECVGAKADGVTSPAFPPAPAPISDEGEKGRD